MLVQKILWDQVVSQRGQGRNSAVTSPGCTNVFRAGSSLTGAAGRGTISSFSFTEVSLEAEKALQEEDTLGQTKSRSPEE